MLNKEDVEKFLALKRLIETYAKEVCQEHFFKTNHRIYDQTSRYCTKFVEFSHVVEGGKYLCYVFCTESGDVECEKVPIKYLWTPTDFKDIAGPINKEIEERNKQFEQQKENEELET